MFHKTEEKYLKAKSVTLPDRYLNLQIKQYNLEIQPLLYNQIALFASSLPCKLFKSNKIHITQMTLL
jgi:hypothetical protein